MTDQNMTQTNFQARRADWLAALAALTTPPRPCSDDQMAQICAEYEEALDAFAEEPTDVAALICQKGEALEWELSAEDRGFAGSNTICLQLWKSIKADIERLGLDGTAALLP